MHCARWFLIGILLGHASASGALCVEENRALPEVTLSPVDRSGQITYHSAQDKLLYQPWSSSSLTGKTYVLYHLAARRGVDAINQPFISALEQLPKDSYQLVVMLNIDDVFTGGRYLARQTFESNAKESSDHAIFILDNGSTLRERWCIPPKSSTVMLVNSSGQIIKARNGALTKDEIHEYVQYIRKSPVPLVQASP